MKKNWLEEKIEKISSIGGYQKPILIQDSVKLDSNENYVISKQFQNDILSSARKSSDIREYPLGGVERLIDVISKYVKMPSSMIGIGNGSDQILDLVLSNIASKQTKILTSKPTFGFFEERCKLYGIPLIAIPFSDDMKLNVEDFIKQSKNADILYLDSPNNPTGFQFSKNDLQKLVKSFDGLVIIDEAYGEFSEYSLSRMVKTFKNLTSRQDSFKIIWLGRLETGVFSCKHKIY